MRKQKELEAIVVDGLRELAENVTLSQPANQAGRYDGVRLKVLVDSDCSSEGLLASVSKKLEPYGLAAYIARSTVEGNAIELVFSVRELASRTV